MKYLKTTLVAVIFVFISACTKSTDNHVLLLDGEWLFSVDSLDVGREQNWYLDGKQQGWARTTVPAALEAQIGMEYDGIAWYARRFDRNELDSVATIIFDAVDDEATLWLNGKELGTHTGHAQRFSFDVSRSLKPEANLLVVRLKDFGGQGGIMKSVRLVSNSIATEYLRTEYANYLARPSADWVRDAVIYCIYPRSFTKEGTFRSIERRIPELKELGVTVLWLMPIHPVGLLNRKGTLGSPYSVEDFYDVNPEFGTMDDFRSLVRSVHAHEMKIIIDMVANHTAWDNAMLFEHPEWYTKNEKGEIVSPNADWHDVADLNYDVYELRKYMMTMLEFWVKDVGVDGFRCDVAEMVPTEFWERARMRLDNIKPIMMLSEGTAPEHHVRAFDLTYSWTTYKILDNLLNGKAHPYQLTKIIQNEKNAFPKGSLRMRFHTNHDENAWDAPAIKKFGMSGVKNAAALMFTLPGVPLIYNGEEVGNSKRLDLFEKVYIDWNERPAMRKFYRQLIQMRKGSEAFTRGAFEPLANDMEETVYSFARSHNTDRYVVVINFSKSKQRARISDSAPPGIYTDVFTGESLQSTPTGFELVLEAHDFRVLRLTK